MKVYVFPADHDGCGHYRLIWPSQVLQSLGHDVVLVEPKQRRELVRAEIDVATNTPIRAIVPEDADVMVFQRITHVFLAQTIKLIRQQGKAVVIDMDDDLSRIHPTNPAFNAMHPRHVKAGKSEHSWDACELACRTATVVQLSTPALVRRYAPSRERAQILRNCVPQWYLDVEHEDNDVIGYGGALHSHANDIPVLGNAMARLQQLGFDFMTIGQTPNVERMLGLPRPVNQLGPVSLREWPTTLTKFGVGIAPLADTEFNRSKSWLKMLEMAAVGVPCVGSPRAEYKALHQLGVGQLAYTPKDWVRMLRGLAQDPVRRRDMSQAGRGAVADFTIEKQAYLWWETWKMAHSLEQAGLPDLD